MIEFLEAPDDVLAVKFRGVLDGAEYDRLSAAIDAKLAVHPRIGVYADAVGFSTIAPEALVKDFRYNLSKLGEWSRFPRAALVTDQPWLKTLVRLADPLFPQFEARAFEPGQETEAMTWASGFRS